MTAITQNLPWFIREPAVAIIGEKCYRSLVEELQLGDMECLKYAVSKGLGIGIVVGGSIMKVPQLLIILNSSSARGLSFPSYVLETLAYGITAIYSYRNNFPFSTYGENLFLTIQNVLITVLIAYYPSSPSRKSQNQFPAALATFFGTLASTSVLCIVPMSTLSFLQVSTLPISLFSKLPQIMTNYRARSTGQLSAFAVISQVAGCLARLFTTATEVGDPILFLGFLFALLLNCIVGLQMWLYWGSDSESRDGLDMEKLSGEEKENIWTRTDKVEVVIPPASPVPGASGRRWSRKID